MRLFIVRGIGEINNFGKERVEKSKRVTPVLARDDEDARRIFKAYHDVSIPHEVVCQVTVKDVQPLISDADLK